MIDCSLCHGRSIAIGDERLLCPECGGEGAAAVLQPAGAMPPLVWREISARLERDYDAARWWIGLRFAELEETL